MLAHYMNANVFATQVLFQLEALLVATVVVVTSHVRVKSGSLSCLFWKSDSKFRVQITFQARLHVKMWRYFSYKLPRWHHTPLSCHSLMLESDKAYTAHTPQQIHALTHIYIVCKSDIFSMNSTSSFGAI